MRRWGIVIVLGLMVSPLIGPSAIAASFDCRKATQAYELIICADPKLSAADEALASAYSGVLDRIPAALQPALQKSQRSWIAYAPRSCSSDGKGAIKDRAEFAQCLGHEYQQRTAALARQPVTIGEFKALAIDEFQAIPSSSQESDFFPVVTHSLSVPVVFGGDTTRAAQLNAWLQALGGPDRAGWDDPDASLSYTLTLERATPLLASIGIATDYFGVGAAHPLFTSTNRHILFATGRPLTYRDVFAPETRGAWLALVWVALKKKIADDMLVDKPTDIVKLVVDPGHWRFSTEGLTVAFNVYEVAAYAMGPQEVTIPWTSLRGLLTPLGQKLAVETP